MYVCVYMCTHTHTHKQGYPKPPSTSVWRGSLDDWLGAPETELLRRQMTRVRSPARVTSPSREALDSLNFNKAAGSDVERGAADGGEGRGGGGGWWKGGGVV